MASDAPPPVRSPCVRICKIDPDDALCIGCCRSREEIAGWFSLPDPEKLAVLAELAGRLRARIARRRADAAKSTAN